MTLLERVATHLSDQHVSSALIGATALAVHGISRSTLDQDVLVVDVHVLDAEFWGPLGHDAAVDVRRGDSEDPLRGVVRIRSAADRDVDVVVGRYDWQREIIARSMPVPGAPIRVADPADLILLKLYAGGSQDRWDIEQLLALRPDIARFVDERVDVLPARSRELWRALRA